MVINCKNGKRMDGVQTKNSIMSYEGTTTRMNLKG